MEDLKTANTRLQEQLLHAQDVLAAQRQVITALGELVSEMMQTLSHYEQQMGAAPPPPLAARKQSRKQQDRQSKRKP